MKYVYLVFTDIDSPGYPELRRVFSTKKSAQEWLDNYIDDAIREYFWISEIEIDKV